MGLFNIYNNINYQLVRKTTNTIFFLNIVSISAQTTAGNASFNFLSLPYSPKASSLGGINISSLHPDLGLGMTNPSLLNPQMDGQLFIGSKPYFAGIQKSIVPIVEVSEVDEQSIISKVESVKESVKEVKLEVKQETLPTEKEESSEEGEESGDEDMEGSKKKKKE